MHQRLYDSPSEKLNCTFSKYNILTGNPPKIFEFKAIRFQSSIIKSELNLRPTNGLITKQSN